MLLTIGFYWLNGLIFYFLFYFIFQVKREKGSGSWLQWFRRGLNFLKTVWSFMLRKLTIGASVPLLRQSHCDTSFLEDLPFGGKSSSCYLMLIWLLYHATRYSIFKSVWIINGPMKQLVQLIKFYWYAYPNEMKSHHDLVLWIQANLRLATITVT